MYSCASFKFFVNVFFNTFTSISLTACSSTLPLPNQRECVVPPLKVVVNPLSAHMYLYYFLLMHTTINQSEEVQCTISPLKVVVNPLLSVHILFLLTSCSSTLPLTNQKHCYNFSPKYILYMYHCHCVLTSSSLSPFSPL